jgi:polysaccharide biosynthesis transport protein
MGAQEPDLPPRMIEYRRLLRNRRWLMTVIFLLTVLGVTAWTSIHIPIYQAVVTVLIEPEPPKVLNIQDVVPIGGASDLNFYPTQYEIIRSRPVVERAVATLNVKKGLSSSEGWSDDEYRQWSSALTVEPKRSTRLVLIKIEGPDPALAAEKANAIANSYAKYNVELKLKGARDAVTWLTEEANRLRRKVEESSQTLQSYRVKAGILGMHEQRQITAQKIMDFNKAYLEAQAQRLSLESKLRELTQITKDPEGAETIYTVAATNSLIQKLKGEAASLETEKSKLSKVYKDKHPEVVKIDAQLRQVNEKLVGELQNTLGAVQTEYKVAKAREDALLGQVNQHRREGQELNEKEIQYQNLQREIASNQELYESVLKRLKETGVAGGLENSNVRIIEEAVPPGTPIRPRKVRNLALSIAAGFALAFGIAFAIEYLDRTIKTPDDVERYLGLPVIGIVPLFHAKRR